MSTKTDIFSMTPEELEAALPMLNDSIASVSESTAVAAPELKTEENPNMNDIRALNPRTRQGIESLQSIMRDDIQYTPEERREAYRIFHTVVPGNVDYIDFSKGEKIAYTDKDGNTKYKIKGVPVLKGFGQRTAESIFGRQAVERQLTDEGGVYEAGKSALDYSMGLLDLPSRTLGAFAGKGELSDEGTYLWKPEYENVDEISEQIRQKYEALIGATDPETIKQIEKEIEDLRGQIEPGAFNEIVGRIFSDPGVLKSLASGTKSILSGAFSASKRNQLKGALESKKKGEVIGKRGVARELLRRAEAEDEAADIVKYAKPESVSSVGRALKVDPTGKEIVLDPVEVERLSGALVEPPRGSEVEAFLEGRNSDGTIKEGLSKKFIPASKARGLAEEGRSVQKALDADILEGMSKQEMHDYLMGTFSDYERGLILKRLQKLPDFQDADSLTEIISRAFEGDRPADQLASLKEMVRDAISDLASKRFDDLPSGEKESILKAKERELLGDTVPFDDELADNVGDLAKASAVRDMEPDVLKEGLTVTSSKSPDMDFIPRRTVVDKIGQNKYKISQRDALYLEDVLLGEKFDTARRYDANPKTRALLEDISAQAEEIIRGDRGYDGLHDIISSIDSGLKGLGDIRPTPSTDLLREVRRTLSTKLRGVSKYMLDRGAKAGTESLGKMQKFLTGKEMPEPALQEAFKDASNFKEAYRSLQDRVKSIEGVDKRLIEYMKIRNTKNLSQAQWDKVTEKVNRYVRSILVSTNTSKQKNAAEAIYNLENYLKRQGLDYLSIKQPLQEYIKIAEYADPVIKGGRLTGFKLRSSDSLVEAVAKANPSIIAKAMLSIPKAALEAASVETNLNAWGTRWLSQTSDGKKAVMGLAKKLFNKSDPSLGEIALARKVLIKAVAGALKAGRITVSNRDSSVDTKKTKDAMFEDQNSNVDLSGAKEGKK